MGYTILTDEHHVNWKFFSDLFWESFWGHLPYTLFPASSFSNLATEISIIFCIPMVPVLQKKWQL